MTYLLDIFTNSRITDRKHEEEYRKSIGGTLTPVEDQTNGCKSFFRFPKRLFFILVFFLANLGYAGFTVFEKIEDSRTTISHVLLVIFTGNLMIYLCYYTMRTWYVSVFRKPTRLSHSENQTIGKVGLL